MTLVAAPYAFGVRTEVTQPWRKVLVAFILLLAWTLFLYRDTALGMMNIWSRSGTFTHAFVVPPLVVWLVWKKRVALSKLSPQPALWMGGVAACFALAWLVGELASVNAITQLAFMAMLVASVPAVMGVEVTRLILFPLGFLFFSVPLGEFLIPQLMEWTADFTVAALRMSGIPVYREGLQFVIPSGQWSVIETCSGVRYLIASLTVGTLFAYLNFRSNRRRLLFILFSMVVPVVANWMRAYFIVMLGHLSNNKLAAGVDHLLYGWLFFGVVVLLMFLVGARWAESDMTVGRQGHVTPWRHAPLSITSLWFSSVIFAVLIALPHLAFTAMDRYNTGAAVHLGAPQALTPGWQAVQAGGIDFKPAFQNPAAEFNRSYVGQDHVVGLYVGYYRHQSYGQKLVSSDNAMVVSRDSRWAQVHSGQRVVAFGGAQVPVRTAELRGVTAAASPAAERLVVWHLYWVNGALTSSDYWATAYGALHRLTGRGDDAAVIAIYTAKEQGPAVLDAFLAANSSAIAALLQKTREDR